MKKWLVEFFSPDAGGGEKNFPPLAVTAGVTVCDAAEKKALIVQGE